jgi:hypothetical protein
MQRDSHASLALTSNRVLNVTVIGQSDSELLISYLTVPYLRMPLIMQFFSSDSRLHSLSSHQVRQLLQAAILEPGRCRPLEVEGFVPQHVPAPIEQKVLLGTPFGLLLNECARAPKLVPESMLRLLGMTIGLGTLPFRAKATSIVLFILRLAVYVESALSFLLVLDEGTHASFTIDNLPSLELNDIRRRQLKQVFDTSQAQLTRVRTQLLNDWLRELQSEEQRAQRSNPELLDSLTQDLCTVHAHTVLAVRNVPPSKLDLGHVRTLLVSFFFLLRRHSWSRDGLKEPISEADLFEIMHRSRPLIVRLLRATADSEPSALQRLLHDVFVASTGATDFATGWVAIPGEENAGRFATKYFERVGEEAAAKPILNELRYENVAYAAVEINLQLLQVNMSSDFLMALDEAIVENRDMQTLFGEDCATMQCTMTGGFKEMQRRRLESMPFELQLWSMEHELSSFPVGRPYKYVAPGFCAKHMRSHTLAHAHTHKKEAVTLLAESL